jgi:hypothetical protein
MFVAMLVFSACKEMYKKKLPKDLKPIDWSNYNDVYTVYWNNINECIERNYRNQDRKIKLYGWVWVGYNPEGIDFLHEITLMNDSSKIFASNRSEYPFIVVHFDKDVIVDTNEIISKKMCYVEGELSFMCLPLSTYSVTVTGVRVYNSNDIYFEK